MTFKTIPAISETCFGSSLTPKVSSSSMATNQISPLGRNLGVLGVFPLLVSFLSSPHFWHISGAFAVTRNVLAGPDLYLSSLIYIGN